MLGRPGFRGGAAVGDRGARQSLARRFDWYGSIHAFRRPGNYGYADLRPALGVAKLGIPGRQRHGPNRRASRVRQAGAAEARLHANLSEAGLRTATVSERFLL